MIIIGLGNPGKEYENTRHNVGFMFLDFILKKLSLPEFREEKKFNALVSSKNEFALIKPQTFMNLSGVSVRSYFDFYKKELKSDSFIVAHDDLDIRFGEYKLSDRSPKGHNGLKSIDERTGLSDYMKIRIGIDNRNEDDQTPGLSYVLQKFSTEELMKLSQLFEEIFKELV